jgi:hypothetical protein
MLCIFVCPTLGIRKILDMRKRSYMDEQRQREAIRAEALERQEEVKYAFAYEAAVVSCCIGRLTCAAFRGTGLNCG